MKDVSMAWAMYNQHLLEFVSSKPYAFKIVKYEDLLQSAEDVIAEVLNVFDVARDPSVVHGIVSANTLYQEVLRHNGITCSMSRATAETLGAGSQRDVSSRTDSCWDRLRAFALTRALGLGPPGPHICAMTSGVYGDVTSLAETYEAKNLSWNGVLLRAC